MIPVSFLAFEDGDILGQPYPGYVVTDVLRAVIAGSHVAVANGPPHRYIVITPRNGQGGKIYEWAFNREVNEARLHNPNPMERLRALTPRQIDEAWEIMTANLRKYQSQNDDNPYDPLLPRILSRIRVFTEARTEQMFDIMKDFLVALAGKETAEIMKEFVEYMREWYQATRGKDTNGKLVQLLTKYCWQPLQYDSPDEVQKMIEEVQRHIGEILLKGGA